MDNKIKFIPDKELLLYKAKDGNNGNDLLNTLPYVDALEQCINRVPDDDAFTIGLYGEWGSGKSSILTTLKERLKKNKDKAFKFVTYDAWKYSQDSFRRMFLFELQTQLGVERSEKMVRFYDNINDDVEVKRIFNWKYFFTVVLSVLIAFALLIRLILYLNIDISAQSIGISIATFVSIFSAMAVFFRQSSDDTKVTVQKSRLFAPEQFEECYDEIIANALKSSLSEHFWTKVYKGDPCKKIIVIIDNIDRCSSQQAQELLTTIKTFMGKKDVIFIIPVAVNALINHIINSTKGETDNKVANEYLRKFFNVALWIKPFHNDEMYDFTSHLVAKYQLTLNPTSISIISREYATNPRRIIQLINNLIEESSLYDPDFIVKHESLLCILLILREEFHKYYLKIVENPSLIFTEPKEGNPYYSVELSTFWRRTKVTILSYQHDTQTIDKLLSNSNVFGALTSEITTALDINDIKTIKEFIEKNPERKSSLVDCLKYKVNKALTRNVTNDIINLMQTVCSMQREGILDDYDDTLFANLFDNTYDWTYVIKYFEQDESNKDLIDFAILLKDKNYSRLLNSILSYWETETTPILKEKDFNKKAIEGICYYCSVIDNKLIDSQLVNLFTQVYNIDPVLCLSYNYKEASPLFNDVFFDRFFENAKSVNVLDDELGVDYQIHKISLQIPFQERTFNQYVDILKDQMPEYKYDANNANELRPFIESLSDLMHNYENEHIEDVSHVKNFATKAFKTIDVNISYNRYERRNIIIDSKTDNDIELLFVRFFFLSSIICGSTTMDPTNISDLMSCGDAVRQQLMSDFSNLINKGVDITLYQKSIITYSKYGDENYLKLLDFLMQDDSEGNLRLENSDASNQLSAILELTKEMGVDKKIIDFIIKVVRNPNVMSIFVAVVSKYSNEELLKLPKPLQVLAVGSFEKNIEGFKDNISVLSIIAKNGSAAGILKLVAIITAKLLTPATLSQAITIILSLHHCNKTSKKQIIATLENIDKKNIDDDIRDNCIKYLNNLK